MTIDVRVYVNCDDAFIAWKMDARIAGLRGFALKRERNGQEETVSTWVGPENWPTAVTDGERHPSTEWPIQKFLWTDYVVKGGDEVRYQVVPMVGQFPKSLQEDMVNASAWTETVTVGPNASPHVAAFFNRGIVASQWVARRLDPGTRGIDAAITDVGCGGEEGR